MFEILLGIAIITFASKVAPALAQRLSTGGGFSPEAQRRLEDMEQRLAQTEERLLGLSAGTHERLVDVEERLDFAERVLQQHRQRDRLSPAD